MRTLRSAGYTVKQIAVLCRCKSRCVVYKALANDVPPSQRTRASRAKRARSAKKIAARRTRTKTLIKKTKVITASRILKCPGRPRKDGTPRGTYVVKKKMRKLVYPSPQAVSRQLNVEGIVSTRSTVRRDLKISGLKAYKRPKVPPITDEGAAARVRLCKRLLRNNKAFFDGLIFSDEKWFDCNDQGVLWQYCSRGHQRNELIGRCQYQSGPKVFVWGAISIHWRVLVIVRLPEGGGGMNSHPPL